MKYFLFVFIIVLVTQATHLKASDCKDLLVKATGELSQEQSKVILYFAHLVKSYLDDESVNHILNSKVNIVPEDMRFKSNVSGSSQVSLLRGMKAALNRPGVHEKWPVIQKKLQEIARQNELQTQKSESVKSQTKPIWHESKPTLVKDNGIDQKNDYGPAVSHLSDGSLVLYGYAPDKSAFYFLTREKKHYPFHGLDKYHSTIVENPPGFTEPFIFIGIRNRIVKIIGAKGNLIEEFELSKKVAKKYREAIEKDALSYSPMATIVNNGQTLKVLFRNKELPNTFSQNAVLLELPSYNTKVLEVPRTNSAPFTSPDGKTLAWGGLSSPELIDLESATSIKNIIPFELTVNSSVRVEGNRLLISNPNVNNKDLLHVVDLMTRKVHHLKFKQAPFMGTTKIEFLGTFKNSLHEDEHFLFFESVDTRHNSLALFNSNTGSLQEWVVESSGVPHRIQNPEIKKLSNGNFALSYILPETASSNGGLVLLEIPSGEKRVVNLSKNLHRIMGVNESGGKVSIIYEDVEAGRVNEIREVEVYGDSY